MEFQKVPTDNLYKFMALSGLVIIFLCFALPFSKVLDLKKETLIISGEIKLLKLEATFLESKFQQLKVNRSDKDVQDIQIKKQVLANKNDLMLEFSNEMRLWFVPLSIGGILGIGIAYKGFWLWYIRLQKYQDIIVKSQTYDNKI